MHQPHIAREYKMIEVGFLRTFIFTQQPVLFKQVAFEQADEFPSTFESPTGTLELPTEIGV
jgi:hypothetical protein